MYSILVRDNSNTNFDCNRYIRESDPPMIIYDVEPCKQNVVEYSRIF